MLQHEINTESDAADDALVRARRLAHSLEQRIRTKDAVAAALSGLDSLPDAGRSVLHAVAQNLHWDEGSLWVLSADKERITCVTTWHGGSADFERFAEVSMRTPMRRGEGIPGRVWETAAACWIPEIRRDANLPRRAAMEETGFRTAVGFPITVHGETLGALEFFSRDERQPDGDMLAVMSNIGSQLGQFIERKLALTALAESEERFRTLANTAPVLIWMAGPGRDSTFFNEPWLRFTGRTMEQECGRGWMQSVHPDDLPRVIATYNEAYASRTNATAEYRLRHHDGSWCWILENGAPRYDAGGELLGYIGSCVDITERRAAEDALTEHQDMLAAMTEALPHLVWTSTEDGRLTHVNARWTAYTGQTFDEAMDRGWEAAVFSGDLEEVGRRWEEAREAGAPFEAEARLRSAGGEYRWHLLRSVRSTSTDPSRALFGTATDIHDRVEAEGARRRTEQNYRTLTESIPALVVTSGPDGVVSYFNERWRAYAGVTGDDPAALAATLHPDDVPELAARWAEARAAGTPTEAEFRIRAADGAYRWHFARISPLHVGGAITGWVGTAVDIDDRKRAEQTNAALNATLARRVGELETLLDVVPIGIGIAEDERCEVIRTNPTFARMLGVEPRDNASLSGDNAHLMPFSVHADGRELDAAELPMQRAAAEGIAVGGQELEVRRAGQPPLHLLEYAAPLFADDGRPAGSIGAFVDITERRRAEEGQRFLAEAGALLASSLDYEETLRNVARLAVPRIADLCVIDMLDAGEEPHRLEVAAAEDDLSNLRGLKIRGWRAGPDAGETIAEALMAGRATMIPALTDDVARAITPDGRQCELARGSGIGSLIAAPLRARGRTFGVVTMASRFSGRIFDGNDLALIGDLAHRASFAVENARLLREAQEAAVELRRANAAKDEFLGLISHELRTPITTIYGNAEVLRRLGDRLEPEDREMAVSDIEQEAQRLSRLVDNIFVLARIEGGNELTPEPLLARRLVDKVAAEHIQRFPHRQVRNHVGDDLPPLMAEPTYVDQILRNLVGNAEKYSPPGEPIDIESVQAGDMVEFRVMDRGGGIPAGEEDKVFTAFYRSPSNAGKAAGTGIGLAVCRRLVEAQGGAIWAGPREGGGTVIRFTLPVDKEHE